MSLILKLLLKAAPLLLFLLVSRAVREMFRTQQGAGRAYDRPPEGDRQGAAGPRRAGRRDPYAVLGCPPSSSDGEIKKRYRELLGKYHPDKFIGQDLVADFVELASKKFQEIQEAYEAIRSRRGF